MVFNKIDNMLIKMANEKEVDSIKKWIIADFVGGFDDVEEFRNHLNDILNYGCVSGIVYSLMSYNDTKKFFINHMEECFEIYNSLIDNGVKFKDGIDYNSLAWLGYEHEFSMLYDEIIDKLNELEIEEECE